MKKILAFAAAGVLLSAAFAGCNNRPPFVQLSSAVDSINVEFSSCPEFGGIKPLSVKYDEATNTVKFDYDVDSAALEKVKTIVGTLQQNFLTNVSTLPYSLGECLAEADANVLLEYKGADDKVSIMIENKDIVDAMKQESSSPAYPEIDGNDTGVK